MEVLNWEDDREELEGLFKHNFDDNFDFTSVDFDDEIVSIVPCGDIDTIDIEVSDDHLFMCNGILTHNSAYGNMDAGMDTIADSLGIIQTADVVMALLANEQMFEEKQIAIKFLKNRRTGRLSTNLLGVDFNTMRFFDQEDDNSALVQKMDAQPQQTPGQAVDLGFGVPKQSINESPLNFN